MSPDAETFAELRQLLALKRHEQPPPGYFDRLPGDIIARLRESESATTPAVLRPLVQWAQWLLNALEDRAVVPTALSAAACILLVVGLTRSAPSARRSAMRITEPPVDSLYASDQRSTGMALVDRPARVASTEGVLPDRSSSGIIRDLCRLQDHRDVSVHPLVYRPGN